MTKRHRPKSGSAAFKPKKQAARIYPRVSTKPRIEKGLGEFAGYKVGMTMAKIVDNRKGSPTYGQEIVVPATILEAPPLKIAAVRAYKRTPYGLKAALEVWAPAEKISSLSRKVALAKKRKHAIEALEKNINTFAQLRLLAFTQPAETNLKKTPEVFELGIGGSLQDQLALAKEKLGAELSASEIFKEGQLVDAAAVTKGFGFQGSIKRWGIKLLPHKAQKLHRKAGVLGPWHPHKTRWTVPQMGQLGFHARTEYNKQILKIGPAGEIVNKAGWKNYGILKSPFILLKGSVPGPTKRLILLRQAIRKPEIVPVQLEEIKH